MVYTCCQYLNFVWITWCMLSMVSVCLVYVVCVCVCVCVQYTCIRGVCLLYVVYVHHMWCMLMHFLLDDRLSTNIEYRM